MEVSRNSLGGCLEIASDCNAVCPFMLVFSACASHAEQNSIDLSHLWRVPFHVWKSRDMFSEVAWESPVIAMLYDLSWWISPRVQAEMGKTQKTSVISGATTRWSCGSPWR